MADVVPRKNKGRQKVKMQRMEKDSNRQVTFSKRRCGLFKKASELSTLCGAEVAIGVFSPGQKAYSFGHPCVETIINRFLLTNPLPKNKNEPKTNARTQPDVSVHHLNMEITRMNNRLEAEKKKGVELNEMMKARGKQFWWDQPVEELEFQQLEVLKASLEELRNHVFQHGSAILIEASKNTTNGVNTMGMVNPNPIPGFNHDNNPAFYNPSFGFGYHQHGFNC